MTLCQKLTHSYVSPTRCAGSGQLSRRSIARNSQECCGWTNDARLAYASGLVCPRYRSRRSAESGISPFYIGHAVTYLSTLAPPPPMSFSTSLILAMEVSPGVVIARAPCAAP